MWCRASNITPSEGRASVARDHLVDQPVLGRLLGLEKAVALHVAFVRQRPGPAHGPPLRNENRPADAGRGGYLQVSLERLQQRVAANVLGEGAWAGVTGCATPIIESRVTSTASSSSVALSLPDGRRGITR
jgi:hypothetical protein